MSTTLDSTKVPSVLASFRFCAGLTQEQLAERAGISRGAVANIERGRHGARPLTAKALSEALGVPVETLFPENTSDAPTESVADKDRPLGGRDVAG